ncbi:MAG: type pilus assembly protein PilQ [Candidatus Binatota bacterium]|nr:type pilus assembly protein PilQ [Candidatus Binatota bacterium]
MIRACDRASRKPSPGFKKNDASQMPRLASLAFALSLTLSACAAPVKEKTDASAQSSIASRTRAGQTAVGESIDPQAIALQDFRVREEAGQTILTLKLAKPITQYRHFPLAQPARIVVDLFGDAFLPADMDSFRVGTNLVGTVRLSSAQGSLRVSIDAISAELPVYSVAPDDGGIKIVVGSADPKITTNREWTLVRGGKRMDTVAAQAKSLLTTDTQGAPAAAGTALTDSKKYTGQKLSFDFKDADIKNIFRLLAEVSGLNIVVTSDVNRRVTLRLVEVPWDQAMDILISTNGLDKEELGNVVRISTLPQLKAERDARVANQKAKENEEALQTVYFNVNYAKVKDLEGKIKTLLSKRPDAALVVDERSNTIMVRDVRKAVEDVSALVAKLDARTPQVLIESNLIETTPTFARALGFRLQFTSGGTTFSSAAGAGTPFQSNTLAFPSAPLGLGGTVSVAQAAVGGLKNLASALEAAETEGNIRIISRPSVATLNNVASTIRSERILRIPLPASTNIASGSGSSAAGAAVATEKIPVGIILTVTPQVSSDGYVMLTINVKSSSLAANPTGGIGVVPFDELNREAVANVLVRDGETIVLGGILKDTASSSEAGIPYLKDIPVFGWLFKSNRMQKDFEELMVFITPRITDAGASNLPSAEQLWRSQMRTTYGDKQGPAGINP